MSLTVINKLPEKVRMTQEGIFYIFDYGNIPLNFDSKIIVDILDEKGVSNLQIKSTCGCTVSSLSQKDKTYTAEIVYDTKRKGTFSKQLIVTYKEGFISKKIIFNIKGTVS